MAASANLSKRLDEAAFKRVDIHEGIDSTLLILQNRFKRLPEMEDIQIVKEYGAIDPIDCYPGQLNQVFMNLIANALDALDERDRDRTAAEIKANPSCIRIRTEICADCVASWITIRIRDNGVGMSETTQDRLFDPFFTTKAVGQGTGLGLSISYQIIVDKHGGKLECHSTEGKGTEFIIKLPTQPKAEMG